MRGCLIALGFAALSAVPGPTQGQVIPVGDTAEEYLRVLQLAGKAPATSFMIRPLVSWDAMGPGESTEHPWRARPGFGGSNGEDSGLELMPVRLFVSRNSALPVFYNDGPLWQGRGANLALDAGVYLSRGPLRVTLRPVLTWAQNSAFDLAPVQRAGEPEYAHPWRTIDLPQRMGLDGLAEILPGESAIEVAGGGVVGGVSTRNLWWGPAVRSSILMSNHAAGLPHAFLATDGPLKTAIGDFEAQWIWGSLAESDFYVGEDAGDGRFLTGVAASWSPIWTPGLSLGAARIHMRSTAGSGVGVSDIFAAINVFDAFRSGEDPDPDPSGSDPNEDDQAFSFFFRYAFPEVGFEVYGEWARNDTPYDIRDLFLEPDYTRAYILGVRKVFEMADGKLLSVLGETTSVELGRTAELRPAGLSFYDHYAVQQGYTNRGQVIGSALGPGGAGQYLAADLYGESGRWRGFVERRVVDNDYLYATYESDSDKWDTPEAPSGRHHLVVSGGVQATRFVQDMELSLGLTLLREWNRYYELQNDIWNVHLSAGVSWRPNG